MQKNFIVTLTVIRLNRDCVQLDRMYLFKENLLITFDRWNRSCVIEFLEVIKVINQIELAPFRCHAVVADNMSLISWVFDSIRQ
jgi:hypothetical protein